MIPDLTTAIMNLSPYSFYDMGDALNIGKDISGNGRDGTPQGTYYPYVDTFAGSSIYLTGKGRIALPTLPAAALSNGLSFVALLRIHRQDTGYPGLLQLSNSTNNGILFYDYPQYNRMDYWVSGSYKPAYKSEVYSWFLLGVTHSASGNSLVTVFNNSSPTSGTLSYPALIDRTTCFIGDCPSWSNCPFYGYISGFALFDKVLSSNEYMGLWQIFSDHYTAYEASTSLIINTTKGSIPPLIDNLNLPIALSINGYNASKVTIFKYATTPSKTISGVVTKGGSISPYTRAWLLDRKSGKLINSTSSNTLGVYTFNDVPVNQDGYLVIGFDDTQTYDPVAKDFL
jgi:hypothetical protein